MDLPTQESTFTSLATDDDAACLAACQATEGCTAGVRFAGNSGFLKNVDVATTVPFDAPGFTSFLLCADNNSGNDMGSEEMGGEDTGADAMGGAA